MKVGIISQYTEVYCDCRARARLDCIAIQCLAKPRYSKGWVTGAQEERWGAQALGRRRAQGRAERSGRARQG